jgi:hypothetical protein
MYVRVLLLVAAFVSGHCCWSRESGDRAQKSPLPVRCAPICNVIGLREAGRILTGGLNRQPVVSISAHDRTPADRLAKLDGFLSDHRRAIRLLMYSFGAHGADKISITLTSH